jgi:hypothetical protein
MFRDPPSDFRTIWSEVTVLATVPVHHPRLEIPKIGSFYGLLIGGPARLDQGLVRP